MEIQGLVFVCVVTVDSSAEKARLQQGADEGLKYGWEGIRAVVVDVRRVAVQQQVWKLGVPSGQRRRKEVVTRTWAPWFDRGVHGQHGEDRTERFEMEGETVVALFQRMERQQNTWVANEI
jgi:hypothetical protein